MTRRGSDKGSRNTNALAVVAGALLALIAVLGFLALISHRAGAQQAGDHQRLRGRVADGVVAIEELRRGTAGGGAGAAELRAVVRAGEAMAADVDPGPLVRAAHG